MEALPNETRRAAAGTGAVQAGTDRAGGLLFAAPALDYSRLHSVALGGRPRVSMEPIFSFPQTVALVLAIFGAAIGVAGRRWRASRNAAPLMLRVGLIGLVALILFNPIARTSSPNSKEKPVFVVLLDDSRSMRTADTANSASRWQAAKRLTLDNHPLIEALAERYTVQFAAFNRKVQPASPDALRKINEPGGSGTDLAEAVNQARAIAGGTAASPNSIRGGILLVSDGRDNGGGSPLDAAKAAKAAGLPIYTLCMGQARQERDVSVTAQRPQTWVAPNQPTELAATLRDTGIPETLAQMDLRRDGRVVQSKTVTIAPGTQAVSFTVREAIPGAYHYSIACRPIAGETNPANNRASISLTILQSRVKVLLLEGAPGWDSKFLAQTLRDDPTLALDTIYQLSDARRFALSADPNHTELKVPRTMADFTAYDVILIGSGFGGFFDADAANSLKDWIGSRGGSLVLLGGQAGETNAILRELSPLVYGANETPNVRVHLTDAGREFPGFQVRGADDAQTVFSRLPPLLSANDAQGEKPLATVLARAASSEPASDADAPEPALLAYQRYGRGKVMAFAGTGLWRWAFPPPEQARYASVYADFWTQTIRWLVSESDFLPGQSLSLQTDFPAYAENAAVNLLGHSRNVQLAAPPVLTITPPNGKPIQIVSALTKNDAADFTATYRPSVPGEYAASVLPVANSGGSAPVRVSFTVVAGQQEDANTSANPELLRRIAAESGGQSLAETDLPALPEKLHAAELAALPQTGDRTLWDNGALLAVLLALYFAPFFLKRK